MARSVQTKREKALLSKLNKKGLIKRKSIKFFLFMSYLALYKFARRKYFQIKEFPSNLRLPKTNKLRILVHINGGLGDALCTRNLLNSIREICPADKVEIYFCCKNKEIFDTFFKKENLADFYISRGYFLRNFDLVLSGCTYLEYERFDKTKISRLAPQFLPVLEKGLQRQKEYNFFIKGDPYTDKLLTEKMISLCLNRINTPLFFAGFEKQDTPLTLKTVDKQTLNKYKLKGKKYIVIHYENCEKKIKDFDPTRPWPKNNWENFLKLFKQNYPDILTVQIGGKIALPSVDICLCNKTNLEELTQIINSAVFFIGGEGGLAHLAGFLKKKGIVLYGPNSEKFLSYPQNINLNSNICTSCIWVTKHWRSACPLGYKTAPCMLAITPEKVMAEVKKLL